MSDTSPEALESIAREDEALDLRIKEHLSQRKIAERMGISQASVSGLLKRALDRWKAENSQTVDDTVAEWRARSKERIEDLAATRKALLPTDPLRIKVNEAMGAEDDRLAKQMGIYAPIKQEISGGIKVDSDGDILSQLRTMPPKAREALAALAMALDSGTGESEDSDPE